MKMRFTRIFSGNGSIGHDASGAEGANVGIVDFGVAWKLVGTGIYGVAGSNSMPFRVLPVETLQESRDEKFY